jgi:hypothetical protein
VVLGLLCASNPFAGEVFIGTQGPWETWVQGTFPKVLEAHIGNILEDYGSLAQELSNTRSFLLIGSLSVYNPASLNGERDYKAELLKDMTRMIGDDR